MLHAGAALPIQEGKLRVGDGLPGHRGEKLNLKHVLVGPRMAVISLLRRQFFVVSIELPNLARKQEKKLSELEEGVIKHTNRAIPGGMAIFDSSFSQRTRTQIIRCTDNISANLVRLLFGGRDNGIGL